MTVQATAATANFNGSGSNGPFTFNFRFTNNPQIVALKTILVTGRVIPLAETVDYVLTGAGSPDGGSLTTVIPLNIGETLQVKRVLPLTQDVHLSDFGNFFASTHEQVFDTLTMMIQQVNDVAQSAIQVPVAIVVQQGAGAAPTVAYVDASAGPINANLPASGEVIIIKTDATANAVSVVGTGGKTVLRQASIDLTLQDESIHLVENDTNWYRV